MTKMFVIRSKVEYLGNDQHGYPIYKFENGAEVSELRFTYRRGIQYRKFTGWDGNEYIEFTIPIKPAG